MINPNQFHSVTEAAKEWRISTRRVRLLCATKRIPGAVQDDGVWYVPRHIAKPADKRSTRYQSWPKELDLPICNMEAAKARALLLAKKEGAIKPSQRNRERDYFIHEAAFHMHRDKEGSLSSDEVSEILHDRAIGGKSIREQVEVLNVKATFAFVIGKVEEQSALSVSLIRQIHSILSCGHPQGDTTLRDEDFNDKAHKALSMMLSTFKASRDHLSQRIAAFMLSFLSQDLFDQRNFQTVAMAANFILLTNEYPPMAFAKYPIRQCLEDYLANGDTIRLARYIANANVEGSKARPSQIMPKRK